MKIRKGPYGYFAVERLGDSPKMCDYAFEVIDSSEEDILLPVYINRTFDGNELAFEFSDLISIDDYQSGDHKKDDKHLSMRRKSIGNLFLSIQHLLDLLINPALMITDPKYVYTNPDGTIIKVCLLPVESDKPLKLSSMDPKAFETLLSHEFFREVISETEASSIVYAASSNNEQMMIDEANKIISTPVAKASSNIIKKELSRPSDKLIYSASFAVLSISSFFAFGTEPALLAMLISAGILGLQIREIITGVRKEKQDEIDTRSETISQILFNDPDDIGLNYAYLETIKPVGGQILKYAVYQDCTTIGSDRFLSDFYINDSSVSPIHAQIYLTQDTVYLSDCSAEGKTYIDDKHITPEIKHEVKNGQKITFGNVDITIRICA